MKRNAKEGKITVLYSYDKQGENIYLIAMIAIKEVLIEVNKGKNFLKNLHVRHAEEFP